MFLCCILTGESWRSNLTGQSGVGLCVRSRAALAYFISRAQVQQEIQGCNTSPFFLLEGRACPVLSMSCEHRCAALCSSAWQPCFMVMWGSIGVSYIMDSRSGDTEITMTFHSRKNIGSLESTDHFWHGVRGPSLCGNLARHSLFSTGRFELAKYKHAFEDLLGDCSRLTTGIYCQISVFLAVQWQETVVPGKA